MDPDPEGKASSRELLLPCSENLAPPLLALPGLGPLLRRHVGGSECVTDEGSQPSCSDQCESGCIADVNYGIQNSSPSVVESRPILSFLQAPRQAVNEIGARSSLPNGKA